MNTDLGLPVVRSGIELVPTLEEGQSLSGKDFTSDQEVRWCPGCGDYAVLKAVQSFLPQLGLRRPVPVLHADLRDALDPRPRAGDRHGARRVPAGSLCVGGDR